MMKSFWGATDFQAIVERFRGYTKKNERKKGGGNERRTGDQCVMESKGSECFTKEEVVNGVKSLMVSTQYILAG